MQQVFISFGISGSAVTAYCYYYQETICHVNCSYTITDTSKCRCPACQQFRDNFLRASLSHMLHRQENKADPCASSSHVNFRYLSSPEKLQHMRNLAQLVCVKDKMISDLQKRVDSILKADSVTVDECTHNDLLTIMSAQQDVGAGENFHSVFWQQQLKVATKLENKNGMRQHPAIIRLCLYLHHWSSGCYSTLRDSGVITLPSERAFQDYKHCFTANFGFSASSDLQLSEAVKSHTPCHLSKYVTIAVDEMYIKAGLVFKKSIWGINGIS